MKQASKFTDEQKLEVAMELLGGKAFASSAGRHVAPEAIYSRDVNSPSLGYPKKRKKS